MEPLGIPKRHRTEKHAGIFIELSESDATASEALDPSRGEVMPFIEEVCHGVLLSGVAAPSHG
jgi:hypothetical protein